MSIMFCSVPKDLKQFNFKKHGTFTIEKKLGEGSFGVVYLVVPSESNSILIAQGKKKFAVKVSRRFRFKERAHENNNENAVNNQANEPDKEKEKTPNEMNFIELREIINMKQLEHQNIVQFLECKIDKKRNFTAILMEYVETDVRKFYEENLQNEQVMNETFYKDIIRQILKGVEHMHSKNLIHRDLKTDNLLFDQESSTLKISDFGFCRKLTFDKKPYTDVGTVCYKPPEILLGNLCYGSSFDVWSVGVIIIELLIGDIPFKGREISVFRDICKYLGPIDDTTMKGCNSLKNYKYFKGNISTERADLKEFLLRNRKIKEMDFEGFYDFVMRFLVLDPTKRISIKDALNHQWIRS